MAADDDLFEALFLWEAAGCVLALVGLVLRCAWWLVWAVLVATAWLLALTWRGVVGVVRLSQARR